MSKLTVIERSTIKLETIEQEYNKDAIDKRAEYDADNYGKYPFIYYRGMTIEAQNISKLKLYNDKFVPYLEMEFVDPTGRFIDDYFPLDDSIISFFMRSPSEKLLPIRMDFKITSFSAGKKEDSNEKITFTIGADLNIDPLYYRNWETYNGTSFDILKTIAKECELGFATNIDNTVDSMKWTNTYETKSDFIKNVTLHSYRSDDAFMWSYIDFYYNLTYLQY